MTVPRPTSFWGELRRRHVVRAVSVYAVSAWVGVQIADVFFPALLLPDWSVTVVAVLAIVGLPVTAVVAWIYDWRSGGLQRTPGAADAPAPGTGGRDGGPVIAVLPFETVGDVNPILTEGLHGDVLTGLSAVSGLDVISRGSVLRYRDPHTPPDEIRAALGAGWMLRGEVQQVGGRVRVHARLVDLRRDRQVWADALERELTAESLFDIQKEITGHIVAATETRLTRRERKRARTVDTEDLAAYRLQVQGRGLLGPRTESSMRRAVEHFERALELDPGYAEAWAGLADALTYLETFGYDPPETSLGARAAAERALELDPEMPGAHFALANLAHAARDNATAVRRLHRSVSLRPSYADAHNLLSWIERLDGRPGPSFRSAVRAAELDPLGSAPLSNLSLGHLVEGRTADAAVVARRIPDLAPEFTTGPFLEALALYHSGRLDDCPPLLDGLEVPWADSGPVATLALVRLGTGERDAAEAMLPGIDRADDPFSSALVRAALGQEEDAIRRFEAIGNWSYWGTIALRYLFPDVLGPIREDARFASLRNAVDRSWGRGEPAPPSPSSSG